MIGIGPALCIIGGIIGLFGLLIGEPTKPLYQGMWMVIAMFWAIMFCVK